MTHRRAGAHATAIVSLANTLGFANWGATPWVIGAMIDGHGLDTAQAGMLSMVELVTMGVAMLAFAPFTAALTAKRIVLPALTIAIVAQLLTIVAPDYFTLVLARSMSGLAFAVMFTLAVVEGSRSHAPI